MIIFLQQEKVPEFEMLHVSAFIMEDFEHKNDIE
jgi:hypothetical protein